MSKSKQFENTASATWPIFNSIDPKIADNRSQWGSNYAKLLTPRHTKRNSKKVVKPQCCEKCYSKCASERACCVCVSAFCSRTHTHSS